MPASPLAALRALTGPNQGLGPDPYAGSKGSVYFPNDLGNIGHWIEFTAKSTNGVISAGDINGLVNSIPGVSGFSSAGSLFGNSVAGGTIRLPITQNLSTDYNPTYTNQDLQMAAGSVLKPFDRQIYGNKDLPADVAQGAGIAGLVGGALGGLVGGALSRGASLAGASGGDALAAALKVGAGIAQNPHKIVLFTGVDFREHQFAWRLSPRNRAESDSIRQIVDMFVYYSHPQYTFGGLFFKYPEFFEISFRYPEYLFKIRPSVCTDVRVNYHGQGYPAYIRNQEGTNAPAPAEVELNLTSKETEIITKQHLNPGIGGGG